MIRPIPGAAPESSRASGIVGRSAELAAVSAGLERARSGIFAITLEGEPGIGKSRQIQAGVEAALAAGFRPVTVVVDEEIRGPFLLARGLVAAVAQRLDPGSPARTSADLAVDALAGRDPGLAGLPPDERLLRALDQASLALRTAALERPLALFLDDVQWADTDSLRLLRYLVRTEPGLPILVTLALRSEEAANATELVNLLADLERLGLVRRLRLGRLRQSETAELLRLTLAGPVEPAGAATLHAQAEGVPFVVQELVRSYREAGLLQRIDGVWTLGTKAGRLLPSAVRTLIGRRAAHLDEPVRNALAEAAVLGRSFRVADLCAIRARLGSADSDASSLADTFAPAVAAGLIEGIRDGSGADFRFSHEQVREFCLGLLSPARRRAVHGAIVDIMTADGTPPDAVLPVLARHALAAGDAERSARFSVGAVVAAVGANAPEEALRLIEEALPVVATPDERVALLRARDDALDMLGRPSDRLEGLAELAALAEARDDAALELEITLRRAAALRLDDQDDRAAALARGVRGRAADAGDRPHELAACLELGQDLLRVAIGEGYTPAPLEADLDGAEEAYRRAAVLAEELADRRSLAAARRELGTIGLARIRAWFLGFIREGGHLPILERVARGEPLSSILPELPILPLHMDTGTHLERALELYEELGDRRGTMSAIIALAYHRGAAEVHLGTNPTGAIEEIRRLSGEIRSLSREAERASAEAQMLFGVHVFARAKVIPDLAIQRGAEAFERARLLGDRVIEFMAAGGTALAHLEIGDIDAAGRWLDHAGTTAAQAPSQLRARLLETWRGVLAGARGDPDGMREHLERAVELADGAGRPAARCEALAALAMEAARLGRDRADTVLLELADRSSAEARTLAAGLSGRPPWAAQANVAGAITAEARGDADLALELARAALGGRRDAMREDPHLEVLLPAARILLAHGSEDERAALRGEMQLLSALIARRTLDEATRVAWFRGPTGRALAELAGNLESAPAPSPTPEAAASQQRLLALVVEGRTNAEIAAVLDIPETEVERDLIQVYARLGVASRAEATALALRTEGRSSGGPQA